MELQCQRNKIVLSRIAEDHECSEGQWDNRATKVAWVRFRQSQRFRREKFQLGLGEGYNEKSDNMKPRRKAAPLPAVVYGEDQDL